MINILTIKLLCSVKSCVIFFIDLTETYFEFKMEDNTQIASSVLIYVLSISRIAPSLCSSRKMRASTGFICATQYYIMKSYWNYNYFDDKYTKN